MPTRHTLPFWGLPLFALGLAALACSLAGNRVLTPTPPPTLAPAAQTPTHAPTALATSATGTAAPVTPAATGPALVATNLSNTGKAETPRLAFDTHGTLHLVWLDKSLREAGDILHRQKDANGDWSKAESLTADFEILYGDISLIRDQAGNICAIFAAAKTTTDPSTIGLYQRCQAGATWSPATKLAITRQTGITLRGYSPARGADGRVHAAYIISAGTIYFDNVQLSTADSTALGPSLAIDKAGGYHVTWVNLGTATSPSTVQYRFSSDQGQTWQAAQTLSTDKDAPDGGTTLAADAEGNVHLLWEGNNVYYRRWTSGNGWGATAALAGDQTGPNPALAVDAQGLGRVVWERPDELPYAVQAVDGSWGAPRAISHQASSAPQIVVDDGGASHVVWLSNKDVYYLARPDFS